MPNSDSLTMTWKGHLRSAWHSSGRALASYLALAALASLVLRLAFHDNVLAVDASGLVAEVGGVVAFDEHPSHGNGAAQPSFHERVFKLSGVGTGLPVLQHHCNAVSPMWLLSPLLLPVLPPLALFDRGYHLQVAVLHAVGSLLPKHAAHSVGGGGGVGGAGLVSVPIAEALEGGLPARASDVQHPLVGMRLCGSGGFGGDGGGRGA